jgi:hypothetical protein
MKYQGLFPIIRRVRRPLVLNDKPVAVVGNVEPVQVEAQAEEPVKAEKPTPANAKPTEE